MSYRILQLTSAVSKQNEEQIKQKTTYDFYKAKLTTVFFQSSVPELWKKIHITKIPLAVHLSVRHKAEFHEPY